MLVVHPVLPHSRPEEDRVGIDRTRGDVDPEGNSHVVFNSVGIGALVAATQTVDEHLQTRAY